MSGMHKFQIRDKVSGMFALMHMLAILVEARANADQKVGVSVEESESKTLIGDDRSVKVRLMLNDEIQAEASWDYDTNHWVIFVCDELASRLI